MAKTSLLSGLLCRPNSTIRVAGSRFRKKLSLRSKPLPSLDYCPMGNEEIKRWSLLGVLATRLPKGHAGVGDALRILANFLAGGLLTGGGKNSRLDGMDSTTNMVVWRDLFEEILQDTNEADCTERDALKDVSKVILQLVECSKSLETLRGGRRDMQALAVTAKYYSSKIGSLKAGESQVLLGGWINVGSGEGHALIYEFERRSDDKYDVYIYTSTGFDRAGHNWVEDKLLLRPVVRYAAVPKGELLFHSGDGLHFGLIQALLELSVIQAWDSRGKVEQKHVLACFDCLEDYRVRVSILEYGALVGQRGGTCFPSVTKVMIRRHAGDLATYKQIMFHLKLRLLVAGYHALQNKLSKDSRKGAIARRMLDQLARKLLRRITKLGSGAHGLGPLVSPDLAKGAQTTAYEVIQSVATGDRIAAESRKSKSVPSNLTTVLFKRQRAKRAGTSLSVSKSRLQRGIEVPCLPDVSNVVDAKSVLAVLGKAVQKCRHFVKTSGAGWEQAVTLQIHHVLDQLPIPEILVEDKVRSGLWVDRCDAGWWEEVDLKELQFCQADLVKLAECYIKACKRVQMPRFYATTLSFQALGHFLALKAESKRRPDDSKARLESYQVVYEGKLVEKSNGLLFFERSEWARIKEAQAYFKGYNDSRKGGPLFSSEGSANVVNKEIGTGIRGRYFAALLASESELREEVNQVVKQRWRDLTDDEIRGDFDHRHRVYLRDLEQWRRTTAQGFWMQQRPIAPRRRRNLALDTKQTLFMEEESAKGDKSLLHRHGLGHVNGWRRMNYLVRLLMYGKWVSAFVDCDLRIKAHRVDPYSLLGRVGCESEGTHYHRPSVLPGRALKTQHRDAFQAEYGKFFQQRTAQRDVDHWERSVAEAKALPMQFDDNPFLERLFRVVSEWRLTPIQLIGECRKDFSVLKESRNRSAFTRLFFRSPVEVGEGSLLGVGDLLLKDVALYESCVQFIQSGLVRLKGNDDDLATAVFYFEFAFQLAKYLSDAANEADDESERERLEVLSKGLDQSMAIEAWLEKPFVERDRAALELCRVLHASLKLSTVEGDDRRELLGSIYASWMAYAVHAGKGGLVSPPIKSYMVDWVCRLTASLKFDITKDSALCGHVCESVAGRLKLDVGCHKGEGEWSTSDRQFPICRLDRGEEKFWQIDLALGRVCSEGGVMATVDVTTPWESDDHFKRLFGNQPEFDYLAIGKGIVVFDHEAMGLVRVVGRSSMWRNWWSIRCQFLDGEGGLKWFRLAEGDENSCLPKALIDDHTFWVPLGDSKEDIKGYVVTLEGHKRRYALLTNGKIVEVDSKRGLPAKGGHLVDALEGKKHISGFLRFDPEWHLVYSKPSEGVVQLRFPRYRSQEGNPLLFVKEEKSGHFVWNDNRLYTVPPKMRCGLLGTIENYLYLKSSEKRMDDKILIPFQLITGRKDSSPSGELEIGQCRPPLEREQGDKKVEQWGRHTYFVYNVDGDDTVKPTTLEGQMFLAYIHYSQKRYDKAIGLIRNVRQGVRLSPLVLRILEMIRQFDPGEDHPEARAVKLHALTVEWREKEEVADGPVKAYCPAGDAILKIIGEMEDYVKSSNNVSVDCRLSRSDELSVLRILSASRSCSEQIKRRLKVLQGSKLADVALHPTGPARLIFSNGDRLFDLPRKPEGFRPPPDRLYSWGGPRAHYDSKMGDYKRAAREIRGWWERGLKIIHYFERDEDSSALKNGGLFREVIRICEEADEGARRELLLRLRLAKLNNQGVPIGDLLLALLRYPDHFKSNRISVPSVHAMDDELMDFFGHLVRRYELWQQFHSGKQNFFQGLAGSKKQVYSSVTGNYPVSSLKLATKRPDSESNINDHETECLSVAFDRQTKRWSTLEKWKPLFTEQEICRSEEELGLKLDTSKLGKGEDDYVDALEEALIGLAEDCREGRAQEKSVRRYQIKDKNAKLLAGLVKKQAVEVRCRRLEAEKELIELANTWPSDPLEKQVEMARVGGDIDRAMTVNDCISALLMRTEAVYRAHNPHLTDKEIPRIITLTLEVLDLCSYEAQLKRIRACALDVTVEEKGVGGGRDYLCQLLYRELSATYDFDALNDDLHVAFRVFAGQTGKIPFKKQVELIEKMMELDETDKSRFRDIVIQLIMGGGKTSVLATILLQMTAERAGRLGFFVVPASLFDQVQANLGEGMKRAFGKELLSIDLERKDLTVHKLGRLKALLDRAEKKRSPLLIKAKTVQVVELEFLSQARSYRDLVRKVEKEERKLEIVRAQPIDNERLRREMSKAVSTRVDEGRASLAEREKLLRQIESLSWRIKTQGDALFDEVDVLLDARQEVNFPAGDKIHVEEKHNRLLHAIYSVLVRSDLSVNTLDGSPSVADVVQLVNNKQNELKREVYFDHVLPILAAELSTGFAPIASYLPEEQRTEFVRYVTNQMTEIQADRLFLMQLGKDAHGDDKERKSAAELIARTRHFLCELIPSTLAVCGNQKYGRTRVGRAGETVPFLGVDAPSPTKFGYHWEWACKQYQMAAAFPPDERQIRELAKSLIAASKYYQQKWGERPNETAEYVFFEQTFGVSFEEVLKDPAKMKSAQEKIKGQVQKCLDIEFEMVARFVHFRGERLTSTGASLCRLFSSRRAMSGTPWNVEGYRKSLADRFEPDKGTVGRILHAARRVAGKSHQVHFDSASELLEKVCQGREDAERIRGIIDTDGQFRRFRSNEVVAKQIASFLSSKSCKLDKSIQGVLFFGRTLDQEQADTLYFWRQDADRPERIGGTSPEALAAKGLKPENCFVYYDERHTTGTDIRQVPMAINLVTCSKKLILRTLAQGLMRMRQFLFAQGAEYIHSEGATLDQIIIEALKEQTVRKGSDLVRFFRQHIRELGREMSVHKIVQGLEDIETFADTVDKWEKYVVTKMRDDPYAQHGHLRQPTDTKTLLQGELQQLITRLGKESDAEVTKLSQGLAKELTEHIQGAKSLPLKWRDCGGAIGLEQEVEMQVEMEQETEVNTEVEQEVEQELQRYEAIRSSRTLPEEDLSREQLLKLIKGLRTYQPATCAAISLKEQLGQYKYMAIDGRVHYEKAFSEPIYGTHAYFHACRGLALPVFHGRQRPPGQVVAIQRKGGFAWLLVSEHEADSVRTHLLALYREGNKSVKGVWFMQSDGSLICKNLLDPALRLEAPGVECGLLEINAFAGNADRLDRCFDETADWLDAPEEEVAKLRVRFLKLRVARRERQNRIFRRLLAMIDASCGGQESETVLLISGRDEKERGRRFGTEKRGDPLEIKTLSSRHVQEIHVEDVVHLGIEWADCKKDQSVVAACEHLKLKGKAEADAWSRKQLRKLLPYHIPYLTASQVKWLSNGQVCYLTKREQVVALNAGQLKGMVPAQRELFDALPVERYPELKKRWMLQAVAPEEIERIEPSLWVYLSRDQIENLPESAAKHLARLKIPKKYGWVSGKLIANIPDEFLHCVTKGQVQQVPHDEVAKLEKIAERSRAEGNAEVQPGEWTSWLAGSQVAFVPLESIKHLTGQQCVFLKRPEAIKAVVGRSKIQAISFYSCDHLTTEQLRQATWLQWTFYHRGALEALIATAALAVIGHYLLKGRRTLWPTPPSQ